MVVQLIEQALGPQALCACAERDHAPAARRHPLAKRAVRPLPEGGVALPAGRGAPLMDSGHGAEHQAVPHADRGIQRGLGAGPAGWRRGHWSHGPSCVSRAVIYSFNPSVRNRGVQSGAKTWATGWTPRCAMASVRSPASSVSSHLGTGSSATHPQCGARDPRGLASAKMRPSEALRYAE
jgi:hypothetical protein